MVSVAIVVLSGLTVSDDQLTLSSSDRNHGIDRFNTGLQRLINTFSLTSSPGAGLSTSTGDLCCRNRACAVD